jgi:hypothetical protein
LEKLNCHFLNTADVQSYPGEHRPDWGGMSFLVDILRPTPGEGPSWYHLLKKASGGCNDLMYSGHMLVSVLTAMAWTVCYTFYFSGLDTKVSIRHAVLKLNYTIIWSHHVQSKICIPFYWIMF